MGGARSAAGTEEKGPSGRRRTGDAAHAAREVIPDEEGEAVPHATIVADTTRERHEP